jgi:hypothetical protein
MKNLVLYILLVLAFTNCSSEKILSEKINNKKWDINYVNNNVQSESIINNIKDEVLNLTHNKPNNLFQETEQLLASNYEFTEYNNQIINPTNKINKNQKFFTESSKVTLKSKQKENIVAKDISIIDNTKKSKFLNKNQKAINNIERAEKLSISSLFLNLLGIIFWIFSPIEVAAIIVFSFFIFFGLLLNIIALIKIKKGGKKLRNTKKRWMTIISFILSFAMLFILLPISIVSYSLSGIGGYGGPW